MSFIKRLGFTKNGVMRKNGIYERLRRVEEYLRGNQATYVGNNRVLVRCLIERANIAYFVEADDLLISPWFIISGEFETDVTKFMLRTLKPDSRCIDVGSNFGYFTCLMARFCPNGKVIGVEADQRLYEITRDNIAINGLNHARAMHAAAGATDADTTLFRRDKRSGNTSIIAMDVDATDHMGEKPAEPFVVRGVRIDDLAVDFGGRVDVMKIDVEGAEPNVFAGADRTIAANPQLSIVMEWSPGQIQAAGFDLGVFLESLRDRGLSPYDLEPNGLASLSYDELMNLPYRAGVVLKR